MRVFVGTSGYSYKEWKGHFYPQDLPASGMLAYYAERLNTVEINNTFYRMPTEQMLNGWAERVPDGFSLVLKASRRITHNLKLKDAGEPLGYLLRMAATLGEKLGPMLFQMPPHLKKEAERLRDFLALFPEGWRAAFEFRNKSWFDDEVYETLRARNMALVVADTDKDDETAIVPTADYGYLRLRREDYGDDLLAQWTRRVSEQPWKEVYVFFKHEDAGAGPKMAARFNELMGRD